MIAMLRLLGYRGRERRWCYLIWYLAMAVFNFDGSLRTWLISLGSATVIGAGLVLCVVVSGRPVQFKRWQRAWLYLVSFGVSSYSAVLKERGLLPIFSPRRLEDLLAVLCRHCLVRVYPQTVVHR